MKFGMFFLGEYAHIITGCAVICVLFLGGWHLPFIPGLQPGDHGVGAMILKMAVMAGKVVFFIFVFMWVRWTLPRFRFDQLMRLAWKGLIPMSLGLLVVAIAGLHFQLYDKVWFTLGGNAVVAIVSLLVAARTPRPVTGRQDNLPAFPTQPTAASGTSCWGVGG